MAGSGRENAARRAYANRRNALQSLRRKDTIGLILMGNEKVGKTALIQRWHNGVFPEEYEPTVEDFYNVHYSYEHRRLNVGVIDMTGSGQFPAMLELYVGKSDSVIYLYDVTDEKSVRALNNHFEQVKKFCKERKLVETVVGTKLDLLEDNGDNVSEANANVKAFCERLGDNTKHCVTSAKLGHNIDKAFDNALLEIVQTHLPSALTLQLAARKSGHDRMGSLCCWGSVPDD